MKTVILNIYNSLHYLHSTPTKEADSISENNIMKYLGSVEQITQNMLNLYKNNNISIDIESKGPKTSKNESQSKMKVVIPDVMDINEVESDEDGVNEPQDIDKIKEDVMKYLSTAKINSRVSIESSKKI